MNFLVDRREFNLNLRKSVQYTCIDKCACTDLEKGWVVPLENPNLINPHSKITVCRPWTPPPPVKHRYPSDPPPNLERFSGSAHAAYKEMCYIKKASKNIFYRKKEQALWLWKRKIIINILQCQLRNKTSTCNSNNDPYNHSLGDNPRCDMRGLGLDCENAFRLFFFYFLVLQGQFFCFLTHFTIHNYPLVCPWTCWCIVGTI